MRFLKVLFAPIFKRPTCAELSILILALLIVFLFSSPNIPYYSTLHQIQSIRALEDISAIETALTEILADTQLSHLALLFNPDGVRQVAMEHF